MDFSNEPYNAVDQEKFAIVKFHQEAIGTVWVPIEKEKHNRMLRMKDTNLYWDTVVKLWKTWEANRDTRVREYRRIHPYDPASDILNLPTSEWDIPDGTTPASSDYTPPDSESQVPFEGIPSPASGNYQVAVSSAAAQHEEIQSSQKTPKGRAKRGKKRSGEVLDPEEFTWSEESIRTMLTIRFSKEEKFTTQTETTGSLWKSIATEMLTVHNYAAGPKVCHDKYRNLLLTYRANKKKQKATGQGSEMVRWQYFDIFDSALGHKAKFSVPTNHLASTLNAHNNTNAQEQHQGSPQDPQDPQEIEEEPVPRRGMSLATYRKAKVGILSAKVELEREKMEMRRELEKERTNALIQTEQAKLELMQTLFNKNDSK